LEYALRVIVSTFWHGPLSIADNYLRFMYLFTASVMN